MEISPELKLLDATHAQWLVENRAETARVSAKLYRLIRERPEAINGCFEVVQLLIAVSFSLWRSVFLSDQVIDAQNRTDDAVKFLSEILETNAIGFSQERKSKDWTFNYYARNAGYRLQEISYHWKLGYVPEDHMLHPPPKERWTNLQKAFSIAVDALEARVGQI